MSKILKIIIKKCSDCPYSEYDTYYDFFYDSGYQCNYSNRRIIDDFKLKIHNLYFDDIPIPNWCELKDIDDIALSRKNKLNKILNK